MQATVFFGNMTDLLIILSRDEPVGTRCPSGLRSATVTAIALLVLTAGTIVYTKRRHRLSA